MDNERKFSLYETCENSLRLIGEASILNLKKTISINGWKNPTIDLPVQLSSAEVLFKK